jgi:hypothetical protein
MKEHDLKTTPEHFQALWDGLKTAELRKDDREYAVGVVLVLREWQTIIALVHVDSNGDPIVSSSYTGRKLRRTITHILRGGPWLADGYVMLSLGLEAPHAP